MLGMVKAAPNDLPRPQLELHIDWRLVRSQVDHHDVSGSAWRLAQLNDRYGMAALQPCRDQLPCAGIGEVRIKQAVGIAYRLRAPLRRLIPAELGNTRPTPSCERSQLMPDTFVDVGPW